MAEVFKTSGVVFAFFDLTNLTEFPHYDPVTTWEESKSKPGVIDRKLMIPVIDQRNGVHAEGFFDIMYNNLWLLPRGFEFGMILEDATFDIYFWNAYLVSRTLNSLVYNEGLGYTIMVGTLPQTLLPTLEKKYALYLYKKGAAILSDTAIFRFDIIDIVLPVDGMRFLTIPDLCKSNEVKIPYSYTNVSATTNKQVEERRNMIDEVKRKVNMSVILSDTVSKTFLDNTIRYGQDKMFGVPILVEQMTPTGSGSLQALQAVYVNENIANYYNVQNCVAVGLYDKVQGIFEMAKVSAVDTAAKKITLGAPIKNNLLVIDTVIYPVIAAYIEDYSVNNITMDIVKYTFTFREV